MSAKISIIRHATRFVKGHFSSFACANGLVGQVAAPGRDVQYIVRPVQYMWLSRGFSSLPPHTLMPMPSLSPTMTQGNIASWSKKEGDTVAPGDVLAEIETDKANMEWEAQEEGFIAKILSPDGSKDIPVGEPVAVLVENESDIAAFKDFTPGSSAASSAPAAEASPPPPPPTPSSSSFPPHKVMGLPSLSPTMNEGNIVEWVKKVGDSVQPGDVLAEVETDKATVSWEAQEEEGYLAAILVDAGVSGVEVGSPVAVIVEEQDMVAAFANFTAADIGGAPAAAASAPQAAPAAPASPPAAAPAPAASPAAPAASGRTPISPYAKSLAASQGLDVSGLAGSGPGGRIVAADLKQAPAASAAPAAAPSTPLFTGVPGTGHVDIPHTQIRRVTAARLLESKQTIPHYYLTTENEVGNLIALRMQVNEALAATGSTTRVSLNDLIIKAAALALKKVPGINASWHNDFIRQYNNVDISVAMQTPIGLMVPIVKDADAKSVTQISADVRRLAGKAKEGKLQPHEFTGGTFTISNLGMMGVTQFCAIVNPPQSAILAVGTVYKQLKLNNATPEEVSYITTTLSCDHRVIDGAMGAEWLAAFKSFLEKPTTLLL